MRLTHLFTTCALFALTYGAWPVEARAQQTSPPFPVLQATARAHRVEAAQPRYPMLAQAARVEGVMLVDTTIGIDGQVASAGLLFSIPMLDAATLDAVKAWRFDPFVRDGTPLIVRTVFAVRFQLFEGVSESDQLDALADAMLLCLTNLEQARFEGAISQCEAAGREATISAQSRTRAAALLRDARFSHENFEQADRLHTEGRSLAGAGRHAEALRPYEQAERRLTQIHGRMPAGSPAREGLARALALLGSDYVKSLEAVGRTRDAERVRTRLQSLPR